ncbi:MAG: hypothetical protein LC115_01015 [Bacteroidia bacterium]|nr:hypothetical protein [Bacteroidia bacterium]
MLRRTILFLMNWHFYLGSLLISGLVLSGCSLFSDSSKPNVTGYRPQYISAADLYKIEIKPAETIQKPGKILLWGKYLFINDIGRGFHVVDNRNPEVPQNLRFVSVPASSELTIKDGFLFVNNADKLAVFDVSNLPEVSLVREVPNVFAQHRLPATPTAYPRLSQNGPTYFECPDSSKGTITGWIAVSMEKPKCSF